MACIYIHVFCVFLLNLGFPPHCDIAIEINLESALRGKYSLHDKYFHSFVSCLTATGFSMFLFFQLLVSPSLTSRWFLCVLPMFFPATGFSVSYLCFFQILVSLCITSSWFLCVLPAAGSSVYYQQLVPLCLTSRWFLCVLPAAGFSVSYMLQVSLCVLVVWFNLLYFQCVCNKRNSRLLKC